MPSTVHFVVVVGDLVAHWGLHFFAGVGSLSISDATYGEWVDWNSRDVDVV